MVRTWCLLLLFWQAEDGCFKVFQRYGPGSASTAVSSVEKQGESPGLSEPEGIKAGV